MLAALLLHAGQVVTVDTLTELLWTGEPPATADKAIQVYASRLRRVFTGAPGFALRRVGHGYRLDVLADSVDLWRFRDYVRRTADPRVGMVLLDRALRLWRGPALADLDGTALGRRLGAALEQERLHARQLHTAFLDGAADRSDAPRGTRRGLPAGGAGAADAVRRVSFAILGPFEVQVGGDLVALTGRQRSVLAILLLNANRAVGVHQIADALWGDSPPAAPAARVRGIVAELRRALAGAGDDLVVTRQPGYLVRVAPGQLDLDDFQRAVDDAGRAARDGRPQEAIARYDKALVRWRGAPLGGVGGPFVDGHATRLREQRLRAVQERTDAMLAVGRHAEVVAELTRVVAEHPLHERSHTQIMIALYRGGRRGEALEVYRELRARLIEELGAEPAAQTQQLHARMLAGDPGLGLPEQRPGPASARQLPADPRWFVGHRAELDQLDAVAADGERLALVVGAAGAGKTALVLRWAHESARRFPGGQLFLDMRGFHTGPRMALSEALPLLLIALGHAAAQIPIGLNAQAVLYRSTLAGRRVLVVLDNVADADQVRALIPGEPGCLALVTSRDRLSGLVAMDGARRITLDVLPAADAVEVLAHAAGRHRVAADPNAAELARLCGRLPLALRIAGARLADRPHLDVGVYVKDLTGRGPMTQLLLDGDGTATVRGAFDLSYEALPPDARRLFRLLGLVPTPAGLAISAAAALAGLPVNEVEPLLDALARFHLINITPDGHAVCHDLLLEYAAQLTAAGDGPTERDTAVDRLLHFYVHTTDHAATALIGRSRLRLPRDPAPAGVSPTEFVEQTQAREWIATEWANLLAALDHAAGSARHRIVWQLTDAVRDILRIQAPLAQGLRVVQSGHAAARAAGNLLAEVAMRLSLSSLRWRMADYQAMLDETEAAETLARRAGWPQGRSAALCNTGIALAHLGQTRRAIQRFNRSLTTDREIGDQIGEATMLINLTATYEQVGDLRRAAELAELAIPLLRGIGRRQEEAIANENLAMVRRQQGHLDTALEAIATSLTISRAIGAHHEEASALNTLGLVYRDAGRYDNATAALTTSLDITQRSSDTRLESLAHTGLASVQTRQGRFADAATSLDVALNISDQTGHHRGRVETLLAMSELHALQGDHRRAHDLSVDALDMARTSGYALLAAQAHSHLAATCLSVDDPAGCLAHGRRAVVTQRRAGQRLAHARTLLAMGRALHRQGRTQQAHTHWRQAHALFTKVGAPERAATAALLPNRRSG